MEQGIKKYSFKHLYNKLDNLITQKMHPEWPWWPKKAVLLFNQLIKSTDVVLEFGSGRSTFWIAKSCTQITSIEHHQDWYNVVKEKINQAHLNEKVNLIYAPIVDNLPVENQQYLLTVKDIKESSIDIVIVDGKFRAQAAQLSIPLIKPGGILLIDDAHRYVANRNNKENFSYERKDQAIWNDIEQKTKTWRSLWIADEIHATLFLIKP